MWNLDERQKLLLCSFWLSFFVLGTKFLYLCSYFYEIVANRPPGDQKTALTQAFARFDLKVQKIPALLQFSKLVFNCRSSISIQ
jgi:hypothetical protein